MTVMRKCASVQVMTDTGYDYDETIGFDPYDNETEVQAELRHEAEMERRQIAHDRWADETFG